MMLSSCAAFELPVIGAQRHDHQKAGVRLGDRHSLRRSLRPAAAAVRATRRFCVCTWAISGLVPVSKVRVMVAVPLELEWS